MVYHISGVKGITVAEEALSLFQHIFFVVYIIFDLSGLKPGQFDLPVPVPQKGSLLIRADGFLAYVDRNSKFPCCLISFWFFSVCICMACLHFLNILIKYSNILIVVEDKSHYNHRLEREIMQVEETKSMTAKLMETFLKLYGEGGEVRTYFAPGRVNLIGEHTDYNGGHVFPCALTLEPMVWHVKERTGPYGFIL